MLGGLGVLPPWQASRLTPAAAAAVTILASHPPPLPPGTLEAALRAVAPHLTQAERQSWTTILAQPLQRASITAPRCVAAFLGQCAVESAGFRVLEEDLHYSAERLCQVWPGRFPTENEAAACAMNPERLANVVYADRLGNGDTASGDGWRFRGRGLIQITGRSVYERFARAMGLSLDQASDHAATMQGAADSAAWFWSAHDLNALANTWSVELITVRINGGTQGAAERARLCDAALYSLTGERSCSPH